MLHSYTSHETAITMIFFSLLSPCHYTPHHEFPFSISLFQYNFSNSLSRIFLLSIFHYHDFFFPFLCLFLLLQFIILSITDFPSLSLSINTMTTILMRPPPSPHPPSPPRPIARTVESSRLRLLLATGLLVAAVALVSTLGPGLLTTPNRLRGGCR